MVATATPLVRRTRPPGAKARVSAVLAILSAEHGATIKLRQDQIGELADCNRTTCSRALAELEREGITRQGWGSVTVLNPAKLGEYANAAC
jgi:CRP-like cAMP-binding protein